MDNYEDGRLMNQYRLVSKIKTLKCLAKRQ